MDVDGDGDVVSEVGKGSIKCEDGDLVAPVQVVECGGTTQEEREVLT